MPTSIFRDCSASVDAIQKRYGKTVSITGKYDANSDGSYNWVILDIVSSKNVKYSLTEQFQNNMTSKVTLLLPVGEQVFNRYLDAEVAMIDKISEE